MAHTRTNKPLRGVRVAITRPVGTAAALRTRTRALGAMALSLPGSSLRAADNMQTARAALLAALASETVIFASPAAARFAARCAPLRTRGTVIAPGAGTARALRRAGLDHVQIPLRADSEGMLAMPILRRMRGKRIGIVGAPGGRGLLQHRLADRGARVIQAQVYRRVAARLDRRHAQAVLRGHGDLYILLSSAQALRNILVGLPPDARRALLTGTAVASSARLVRIARKAGFAQILRAASASDADLLAAIADARATIAA